jgi:DNA-binding TFAR19-related protein (PDSD5 family)
MIIRNGQMGVYREKISDDQLIGLLEGFNAQQETKIKFKRKIDEDEDDDDLAGL